MIETLLILLLFLVIAFALLQFIGTVLGYLIVAAMLIGGAIHNYFRRTP